MTVQSLYNRFAKGVAEQLDGYGFVRDRGGRIFRRVSPQGDVAVVELQSSDHSSKEEKRFYINLALVLGPKWRSDNRRSNLPEDRPTRSSSGIWDSRLTYDTPGGNPWPSDQWCIADEQSLAEVSELVRQGLDEAVPELIRMLDREWLFAEAPRFVGAAAGRMRAWILADRGPSGELDRLLEDENDDAELVALIRDYANTRVSPGQDRDINDA